jgi:adenine-specific DNA-methyltransferase
LPRRPTGRKKKSNGQTVTDIRHRATRKNNPPAGLAPTYEVRERQATRHNYDPHLDPQLVWSDKPGLKANWDEIWDPDRTAFDVDVVSLHIHERISTRAILEAVRRPEPQISLFGETQLPADQQVEFYKHDVNWANRLILGDSLLVMNSLLVKEGMAGKVQMIYVDPPYGIRYSSNFQPRTNRRDVRDRDEDLTHEPEQIKAYRDTWKLGIHSYLTYLRDRLLLACELLSESGSIFVQISDENLHHVREVMDEVLGAENFIVVICYKRLGMMVGEILKSSAHYLLWYARDIQRVKFHKVFEEQIAGIGTGDHYNQLENASTGEIRPMSKEERGNVPPGWKPFQLTSLQTYGLGATGKEPVTVGGQVFKPGSNKAWRTTIQGLKRLSDADRIHVARNTIRYKQYLGDFPFVETRSIWEDTGRDPESLYAVQTPTGVVERCILMTTEPGDLVLDPTCGSGTTAYCAEKWGRRWITCDTSRVALAIARQRLMTARYEYYQLKDPERGVASGFDYETASHVTLESIVKNTHLDRIGEKYNPKIKEALDELNRVLKNEWKESEVPREAGKGWSKSALTAHRRFWTLIGERRQESNASISANAPQETLFDRPRMRPGITRVSGPFTVEAIPVPAFEDPSRISVPQFEQEEAQVRVSDPAGDYLTNMISLLKQQGGVIFPGGRRMALQSVRPLSIGMLHAEAEAGQNGKTLRVAISFGPQYGPVTAMQVQETIPTAQLNGYDALIFAGFSFDPEAQALLQKQPVKLQVHFANVAPDVLVGDLLKTNRASQIFTAFGQPDIRVRPEKDGNYVVELLGVDIYDPLTGETDHAQGDRAAAWFLDSDYDGMTFHVSQAFFPGDDDAWDKLQRALRASIDEESFEQMRGTKSFPFKPGDHKRVAVKVIDFRGNEVVRVMGLNGAGKRKP